MAITPIEMASMAPKSFEASTVKQNEHLRQEHTAANINAQFQAEKKQDSQQTVKMSEAEYLKYRYDAKEKGNNSYQGNQNRKKKGKSLDIEEGVNLSSRPGGIDIKI